MRTDRRLSITTVSHEFGIDTRTVLRLAGSAIRKRSNGQYAAKPADRLLRVVDVLTVKGRIEVATRDSRQASQIGKHWDAVQRYLQTGDDAGLKKFCKKKITDGSGKRYALLTDVDELNQLASAGVLSFESLYARST
jgi:hypothetical protein